MEGSYLNVFSPEDEVMTGIEFTAKWEYNDGSGVTEVRSSCTVLYCTILYGQHCLLPRA